MGADEHLRGNTFIAINNSMRRNLVAGGCVTNPTQISSESKENSN